MGLALIALNALIEKNLPPPPQHGACAVDQDKENPAQDMCRVTL